MDQPILKQFGGPISRVEKALKALRKGQGVLVTDNADRENEGDLIFAAETLTVPQMAMLIRECSGIVCLCLTEAKIKSLGLPMMVENNTSAYNTAFTISIEAAEGVTTGVSAADRLTTIKAAIAPDATPASLNSPGHVFPLAARPRGVLERGGHTEATVDLTRLAGLAPCGVLCELTNPDGTMAKLHEIVAFAIKHQMAMCTVQDIIAYREHIGDIDAEMVVPENTSAVTKPTRMFPSGTFSSSR
ncbi:3,4-dihydroxy-2-butanone 4-phosphate synthase [Pseudodesulfovibrio mercurii]|uniref:3,4-dihydroxy-2-butanone 4-phosphate synthase n=1 Tax=Pseudodesulfovibrio mercurii TaxID=641491 RepID=F0JFL5_9BACT|nr:3,4-dihydroxy-2-butanone 4-phosphate synthase [Pseudodesulfovibrio mercurii]